MRNRYLVFEFFLTFCLLGICILMQGISTLKPYLIFGLVFGFSFSWLTRNKTLPFIGIIINICGLLIFTWIIYSLLGSTFFYREVILIAIKGVIVLEIILSLGAFLPLFLEYLQVLSIPVFMSSPLFTDSYNIYFISLLTAYIICWLVILRIKLYASVGSKETNKRQRYYSIFIAITIFLISAFLSLSLFYNILLGKHRKGGLFPEKSLDTEGIMEDLEKEYYELQDKINRQIQRLIPQMESTKQRQELVMLFNPLIMESLDIQEVDKAEEGLISFIKQSGLGLDARDVQVFIALVNSYVDKKVLINLKRIKDYISDIFKRNAFNLKEKIYGLRLVNKMQYARTYQQNLSFLKDALKMIDDSSVNKDVKRELKDLFRRFREWKNLDIYRRKFSFLKTKINTLDTQSQKTVANLFKELERMRNLAESREIEENIKMSKDTVINQSRDIIDKLQELLGLKLEMFLSLKGRALKEKLEGLELSEYKLQEFKEQIETLKDTQVIQEFVKNAESFKEELKKKEVDVHNELKEVLETKIHIFVREKMFKIEEMLKEGTFLDSGKTFLKEIAKVEYSQSTEDIDSKVDRIKQQIREFQAQGFISKDTQDELINAIEEIRVLMVFKIQNNIREEKKDAMIEEERLAEYQRRWQELIDKSSLEKIAKEMLKDLTRELYKAQTISQLENIKERAHNLIESLSKEGIKDKEIDALKYGFDTVAEIKKEFIMEKAFLDLRKDMNKLQPEDPKETKRIQEYIERIKDYINHEELKRQLESLKEHLDLKTQALEFKPDEAISQSSFSQTQQDIEKNPKEGSENLTAKAAWQIYLYPSRLVIPLGTSFYLKATAVYNNTYIKDIDSELEWLSSDPKVAQIDEMGMITTLSRGNVEIIARYKGIQSAKAEIIVTDRMDSKINSIIRNEVIK